MSDDDSTTVNDDSPIEDDPIEGASADDVPTEDAMSKDCAAEDGAVADGEAEDGAVADGAAADGAVADGAAADGAAEDGAAEDGAAEVAKSQSLAEALDRFQIELPPAMIAQLDLYCSVLWEWNTKLNLTRHTDYDTFVARDVIDTLMLSELLAPDEEILDIGSGGGVPGITLGIIRPDLSISLAESVGKKAEVLNDIVSQVNLPQAVFAERAESLLDEFRYDALTCRAVGPLWKICKWLDPHWGAFRRLLAIKGPKWVEERKEARHLGFLNKAELRKASEYTTPGTNSQSFILKMWRKGTTEPTPEIKE
ncbi:MAG: 16S rRNA (guanine527-N7)-methyltransferase [Pirellulaceae bacterium]